MEETIFTLRYEGEGISEGLEPAAFAESMRGFAEFITTVTEAIYGDHAQSTLKVHRVTQGSYLLEILQQLGDVSLNDLAAIGASISTEMKLAIDLLKHLRGSPPKDVQRQSGGRVEVSNTEGNVLVVNNSTINIISNADAGSSVERFVKPILNGQATGVSLSVGKGPAIASVAKSDAPYMVSVANEQPLLDGESQLWLTVNKAVLEGGAKWTFSDGLRPITAKVSDPDFLAAVGQGTERFGNGDRLMVRMRAVQSQRGTRLRTQYEVIKVLKHERKLPPEQRELFDQT